MVITSSKDGNPVPTNCFVFPPVRMDVLLRQSSVDYNKSNSLKGQIKTDIKTLFTAENSRRHIAQTVIIKNIYLSIST